MLITPKECKMFEFCLKELYLCNNLLRNNKIGHVRPVTQNGPAHDAWPNSFAASQSSKVGLLELTDILIEYKKRD